MRDMLKDSRLQCLVSHYTDVGFPNKGFYATTGSLNEALSVIADGEKLLRQTPTAEGPEAAPLSSR
jgi:hypothetical protein